MTPTPKTTGVDGCRAGWFAVTISADAGWSHKLHATAASLAVDASAGKVLIDIPIGLPESGTDERSCDRQARKLLGKPRNSSVFPVPCRPALAATNYEDAKRINERNTGRMISPYTWGIVPKIREVDQLIREKTDLKQRFVEVHPELIFWSLNLNQAMQNNKKTAKGRGERMAVIRRFFPPCDDLFNDAMSSYLRREVARDDIIDAMANAVAGYISGGKLAEIPVEPEYDGYGIPMRMVYPRIG